MGMDEYLTKPIQLHVLRAALEKLLPATKTAPAQSAPLAPPRPEECVTALVNVAILKELVGDDPKTVGAILRDYAASATKLAAELHGVFAEGEFHAVGAIAHKLKSSSRTVGASALGDYCAELGNAARAENRSSMAQWISLFDEALSSVLEQITEIVEKKAE